MCVEVVVMDALVTRLAAGPAGNIDVFRADMPRPVPVERWDTDNAAVCKLIV